jgi:glucose/arabinose dehydrogenase
VPKPSFQGEGRAPGAAPGLPIPTAAPPASGAPGSATPPPSASPANDPAVVAKHLDAPVGLAVLPDGTALVGERTTGRIVRVQPQPDQPVHTVRTLTGLDASGDGGLLDLALSPHYDEDNLIYAYLTTAKDNRVVDFTLTGPVTPVLTAIPKGRTGNTGRIAFGNDGDLYVGTGDAGKPSLAADLSSLAGKVLRVTDIGRPAPHNPKASSPVFTSGHREVDGLCLVDQSNLLIETEGPGADGLYNVNALRPGAGYGWPTPDATSSGPVTTLPINDGQPGGCAVLSGVLYVTSLQGDVLVASRLAGATASGVSAGKFTALLKGKYGRLRTVVAAADGALWLTTSNRDGHGKPSPDDERVLRIVPAAGTGGTPV